MALVEIAGRIEPGPYVEDIFIQLTGKHSPPRKGEFPGVFFVLNALQSAIILAVVGHVDEWCVKQVSKTFDSQQEILRTLEDGLERELYSAEVHDRWKASLCD